MPEVSDRQGGDNIPSPVEPVAGSNPISDSVFMEHIVRAVAAGMVAGASSAMGEGYERDGLYDLPWRRGC
jgi:hypothetical protein